MIQANVGSNLPSDFRDLYIKVYKFSNFSNGGGHMFDSGWCDQPTGTCFCEKIYIGYHIPNIIPLGIWYWYFFTETSACGSTIILKGDH